MRHPCPSCGKVRDLPPYRARQNPLCLTCHNQRIAPLGFAAAAERYGRDFAIRKAAAYRLAHPSSLEQQFSAWLEGLGLPYSREVPAGKYYVDFVVCYGGREIAVEVDGTWVHRRRKPEVRQRDLAPFFEAVLILPEETVRSLTPATPPASIFRCTN